MEKSNVSTTFSMLRSKSSHNTKIYKLKEILKNLIKVKVLSLTKTLFSEGSRKVNHT